MSWCLYTTSSGQAYAVFSFINWLVPLLISGSHFVRDQRTGRVGKQFALFSFGLYIFFWQFVLYALQAGLHMQRPDPFCPILMTDGFPSSAAFHTAVGGSLIFMLSWMLDFALSWMSYLWLGGWFLVPPFVLLWFGFNTWQEIVISLCLGVLATLGYFLVLRYYLVELMPYILNSAPWTWFYCLDTWVQDEAGQEKTERIRKALESRK